MLTAAPKGDVVATLSLSAFEDQLLRAAFGRYGGAAPARSAAAAIVRRFQSSGRGYWFLCDCRLQVERRPALVPVAESHIRRHEIGGWPQHAVTCDFYREQSEQAALTASFAPLPKRGVRLVRPWADANHEALDQLSVASAHTGRPQLARVLVRLMTAAGLQKIGPDCHRSPPCS